MQKRDASTAPKKVSKAENKRAVADHARVGPDDAKEAVTSSNRRCITCNTVKALSEFHYAKKTDIYRRTCKTCCNKAIREKRLAEKGLKMQPVLVRDD